MVSKPAVGAALVLAAAWLLPARPASAAVPRTVLVEETGWYF